MKFHALALIASFLLFPQIVHAGITEVSATTNFRRSYINDENYQEVISYTGSLSYYFWEMSAIELSYTSGETKVITQIGTEPRSTIRTAFELIGLDFVLTLGGREASFQPYIKIGGAYLRKEVVQEIEGISAARLESPDGLVPSAGLGFKLRLTKEMALKIGADGWSSPLDQEPVTVDYAGRAGISFTF